MQRLNFVPDRICAATAPSNMPLTTIAQVVTLTGPEGEFAQFSGEPDTVQNAALDFLGQLARDGHEMVDRAGVTWRCSVIEAVLPYSTGADTMLAEVCTRLQRGAVDPVVDAYPVGPHHTRECFDPVIGACHRLKVSELRNADRIRRVVGEGEVDPVIAEAGRIADVLDGKCWFSAASRR
ncbi:hypothetical protein ABB55_03210 [Prosthecomicrobium hirschii]|uniref:Uncharacterized protein n=1 Tax=Prosthecodimorpha hirschii TaxID=665126 RepID=A0A0P6VMF0_9HYPH|nr:hypothetical protein [Prosthecomicrobium hirschii]KPL51355.1 hypothetical protein ABB55_03210 [Prosthecomicrobium hirschii]